MNPFRIVLGYFLLCFIACTSAPPKEQVAISEGNDGTYLMEYGPLQVEIKPQLGGRISGLIYKGQSLMTGPELGDLGHGSTFWPSPQAVWSWPPPAALDSKAYAAQQVGDTLVLTSQVDSLQGLVFTKKIFLDTRDTSLLLTYQIHNQGDSSRGVAPWEISRVPKGGLTFFPKGENEPQLKGFSKGIDYELREGVYWYANQAEDTTSQHQLSIADGGEGWLAHASGAVLWVKSFEDIPLIAAAPGEGEIPIYVSPEKPFMEVEVQGAYRELAAGASYNWPMRWSFYPLSPALQLAIGNSDLVRLARNK
ncbi:MAG: DUF4380 domain-containing protein [Bacteroidota bacterium]